MLLWPVVITGSQEKGGGVVGMRACGSRNSSSNRSFFHIQIRSDPARLVSLCSSVSFWWHTIHCDLWHVRRQALLSSSDVTWLFHGKQGCLDAEYSSTAGAQRLFANSVHTWFVDFVGIFLPKMWTSLILEKGNAIRACNVSEMYKLEKNENVKFSGYAGPICGSGA
jgi:hypothetical protein